MTTFNHHLMNGLARKTSGGILAILGISAGLAWGNSPADFLNSAVDARTHALGGAFAADPMSGSSFNRNPASLCYSTGTPLSTTLVMRPGANRLFQVNMSKMFKSGRWGASLLGTSYGSQEFVDENENKLGSFKNSDMAGNLSYGRSLGPMGLGMGATVLRKKVADQASTGVSLTGAAVFPLHDRIHLGFSVNDLSVIKPDFGGGEEPFETQFRGGLAGRVMDREAIVLNFLIDLVNSSGKGGFDADWGTELNLNKKLFLRGGFSSSSSGGRLGLGLHLKKMRLDWSMQLSPLDSNNFMNFTLGVDIR